MKDATSYNRAAETAAVV